MFNLFYPFKHLDRTHNSDEATRTIESVLQSNARRIQAIDTETDEQWRRLKSTLESKQSMSDDRFVVAQRVFFKPAFSFVVVGTILIVMSVV